MYYQHHSENLTPSIWLDLFGKNLDLKHFVNKSRHREICAEHPQCKLLLHTTEIEAGMHENCGNSLYKHQEIVPEGSSAVLKAKCGLKKYWFAFIYYSLAYIIDVECFHFIITPMPCLLDRYFSDVPKKNKGHIVMPWSFCNVSCFGFLATYNMHAWHSHMTENILSVFQKTMCQMTHQLKAVIICTVPVYTHCMLIRQMDFKRQIEKQTGLQFMQVVN